MLEQNTVQDLTTYVWGNNKNEQLAIDSKDEDFSVPQKFNAKQLSSIEQGGKFGLGISKNGVLYSWGQNKNGQCGQGFS